MRTDLRSLLILCVGVVLALSGCSTDSPTEPQQTPPPIPGPGGGGDFNVSVSVSPGELEAGGGPATVTIQVRRADNGAPPPNGSIATVSATMGDFNTAGSGQSSGSVSLQNGNAQLQYFAGTSEGTAIIQAAFQSAVGQAIVRIAEAQGLFISRIVPSTGRAEGGQRVEIQGTGFESPVRVQFGGSSADVTSVTGTSIVVNTPPMDVPEGGEVAVTVSVTINVNESGEQSDSLPNAFVYSRISGDSPSQPVILSVAPTSGPNEGGTRVVINGDGFEAPIQVLFGQGSDAAGFNGVEGTVESVSATQIVVISPSATGFGQSNLNQQVDLLVRNVDSGNFTVAPGAFRYGVDILITSVGPGEGPYFGGTVVTIFGQGFDEPVAVEFGGRAQEVRSVTGTEILARSVPIITNTCADESGNVRVVNIETGDSDDGPNWIYRVVNLGPNVSGVSPSTISQAGGDAITVSGSNFFSNMGVVFIDPDGERRTGTVTGSTDISLMVTTPPFPNASLDVEACDDNMDGAQGERFVDTEVEVEVTNRDTTCNTSPDNGTVLVTPTDTSCRNDVAEDTGGDP